MGSKKAIKANLERLSVSASKSKSKSKSNGKAVNVTSEDSGIYLGGKPVVSLSVADRVLLVRLSIDKVLQYSSATFGEDSDVYRRVFNGKAWLGEVLGCLGSDLDLDREPIVDIFDDVNKVRLHKLRDYLQQVLHLQDLINDCIDAVDVLDFSKNKSQKISIAKTYSYSNLCEARFSLGYKLSLIKNGNA